MNANILFFSETQTLPAYKIENKMQQGIKTSLKEEYKNKKFTKGKKKLSASRNSAFRIITKFKKKTYYFRERTYKNSGRRKVYGKWSKIVKVKIRI